MLPMLKSNVQAENVVKISYSKNFFHFRLHAHINYICIISHYDGLNNNDM